MLVIFDEEKKPEEMSNRDALSKAKDLDLDLVLISDKAKIPVAKITDYGKFKYERKKKAQLQKKNQKIIELKEVRLTPRIGEHDLQVKMKDAKRFLEKGNKVKVSLRFRRNELQDQTQGREIIERFKNDLSDISSVEKEPLLRGIFLDIIMEPLKK